MTHVGPSAAAAGPLARTLPLCPDANGRVSFHAVLVALVAHANGGDFLGAPLAAVPVAVTVSDPMKPDSTPSVTFPGLVVPS
jgi:hypothetical protein